MSTHTLSPIGPTPAPAPHLVAGEDLPITPVDPARHAAEVHAWLTHPRAWAWQMGYSTAPQVEDYLAAVAADPSQDGWIIEEDGRPVAYLETYRPSSQLPASVHPERPGDLGMHLLTAPPTGAGERGFTDRVMAATMRHCLQGLGAQRVVVEPDARHDAILAKNAAAGFRVLG